LRARFRKQIRHISNFLKKARGRPQVRHRWYARTLNFGGRCCLMMSEVLAMAHSRKGIPRCASSARAASSVRAVVQIVTSMPRTLSILS